MDDSLVVFGWTLGGAVAFGLLGLLFGGFVGWFNGASGRASGTILGRKVAAALSRLSEREMNDVQRGALIGAVDGAIFMGAVGLLVGLIAGWRGQAPAAWLLPLFQITMLLMALAIGFGLLALGILRLRLRAIVPLFVCSIAGGLLAAGYFGIQHIVPGSVIGLVAGLVLALLLPRG
jgi:hypothetical protein